MEIVDKKKMELYAAKVKNGIGGGRTTNWEH